MNPVLGIWQVARGRAEGLARFGSTTQAFLASLAPLIAFPLVGAVIVLMREGALAAFLLLTVTLIAQLDFLRNEPRVIRVIEETFEE